MITEGEPTNKLARLQEYCTEEGEDEDSLLACSGSSPPPPAPPSGNYVSGDSSNAKRLVIMDGAEERGRGDKNNNSQRHGHRNAGRSRRKSDIEYDEPDSDSTMDGMATGGTMMAATTLASWSAPLPLSTTGSDMLDTLDLSTHLKRKDMFNSRKQREFIPDNKKDDSYWDRRRRNNEAAKRSREKRRLNDMVLESRVFELTKENTYLRAQLVAIREKHGIIGETLVAPDQMSTTYPAAEHQVALNLSKRAKLLSPLISPGGVHNVLTPAGQSSVALRSLVMASALHQQQPQPASVRSVVSLPNGKQFGTLSSSGTAMLSALEATSGRIANGHILPGEVNADTYGEYWAVKCEDKSSHAYVRGIHPHLHPRSPHGHRSSTGHSMDSSHHPQHLTPSEHHGPSRTAHSHEALLSALNGTNHLHENGYTARSPSAFSPNDSFSPPNDSYSPTAPMALTTTSPGSEYSHPNVLAAHLQQSPYYQTASSRNGVVVMVPRQNASRPQDDCCSSGSCSGDEGAIVSQRRYVACPASPTESIDNSDNYCHVSHEADPGTGIFSGGGGGGPAATAADLQLHLPHKLRHKPRLSECSMPSGSPPSHLQTNGIHSPPLCISGQGGGGGVREGSPVSPASQSVHMADVESASQVSLSGDDERENVLPDDDDVARRSRKYSVFGMGEGSSGRCGDATEPASRMPMGGSSGGGGGGEKDPAPPTGNLKVENSQLKMEMKRLAIEVANLKDILMNKEAGGGGSASSNKSDTSSRDSGFATDGEHERDLETGST